MSSEIIGKSLTYVEVDQDIFRLTQFQNVMRQRAAVPVADVQFIGITPNTADQSSYTYLGVNFGPPAEDSRIVVGITASNISAADSLPSGVTIGGVAASALVAMRTNSNAHLAALYGISHDGLPSGPVVVNFGSVQNRCTIHVFRLYNTASLTPVSANTATCASGGPGPFSLPLTVPPLAVGILAAHGIGAASATWAVATERSDDPNEHNHTTASIAGLSGALTPTVTFNTNLTANSPLVGAVWESA